MSGQLSVQRHCPKCGYAEPTNDDLPPAAFYRPWHVRGRSAVKAYVETLGQEAAEWLLALFVDKDMHLLAVDTVARGDVSSCRVNFGQILGRGHALKAAGFILVHNHPSGDPTPSQDDVRVTARLRHLSQELDLPLLDHLIIAGDEMKSMGEF
ncbi:MAG TPA: JAB domain-containing protein [Sphingomicrobium sp.]